MKRKVFFVSLCIGCHIHALKAQKNIWSLKECIDTALQKNISLNQNLLTNEINNINLLQAKGNLIPTLNASDIQGFSFGRTIDPFSNQFTNQNINTNNLAINSNVTIFSGFQNINIIRQQKINCEAGWLDLEKLKNDIALNVTLSYLEILFSYETINIAQKQLESTESQVSRTEKYVTAGKLTEGNLLQIKSQLASDRLSKINAENQLQLSKVVLMQLMEMPVNNRFEIEKPTVDKIPFEIKLGTLDIYKAAEDSQPQIKSAILKIKAAEIGYKVSEAMYLPKFTLGGSLRTGYSSGRQRISYSTIYQKQNIGTLESNPSELVVGSVPQTITSQTNYSFPDQFKDNFSKAITINVTIPILNNFQVKSNVSKAKITIINSQLNELAVKSQLRKNIEQAYTDVLAAISKLNATEEQNQAEQRAYQDMEKKYSFGMITAIDFLIEKNNYFKSSHALLQAKYDLIFKLKVIDYYLGKPLTL